MPVGDLRKEVNLSFDLEEEEVLKNLGIITVEDTSKACPCTSMGFMPLDLVDIKDNNHTCLHRRLFHHHLRSFWVFLERILVFHLVFHFPGNHHPFLRVYPQAFHPFHL